LLEIRVDTPDEPGAITPLDEQTSDARQVGRGRLWIRRVSFRVRRHRARSLVGDDGVDVELEVDGASFQSHARRRGRRRRIADQ
jgi:hypothetical protein